MYALDSTTYYYYYIITNTISRYQPSRVQYTFEFVFYIMKRLNDGLSMRVSLDFSRRLTNAVRRISTSRSRFTLLVSYVCAYKTCTRVYLAGRVYLNARCVRTRYSENKEREPSTVFVIAIIITSAKPNTRSVKKHEEKNTSPHLTLPLPSHS